MGLALEISSSGGYRSLGTASIDAAANSTEDVTDAAPFGPPPFATPGQPRPIVSCRGYIPMPPGALPRKGIEWIKYLERGFAAGRISHSRTDAPDRDE